MPFVASVTWLTCKSYEKRCKLRCSLFCLHCNILSRKLSSGLPEVFGVGKTAAQWDYSCTQLNHLFHDLELPSGTTRQHVKWGAMRAPCPVTEEVGSTLRSVIYLLCACVLSEPSCYLRESPFYRFGNWGFSWLIEECWMQDQNLDEME